MKSYSENLKGFGLIGIVLAVAIVAGVVFGGLYWAGNGSGGSNVNTPAGAIGALEQAREDVGEINEKIESRNQETEKITDDRQQMTGDDIQKADGRKQTAEQITDDRSQITGGDGLIEIYGISEGDIVGSPVDITGETSVDTDELIVELRNQDHEVLVEEKVNVRNNEFSISLNFQFNSTKEGFIAVYNINTEDKIEIPVSFETE